MNDKISTFEEYTMNDDFSSKHRIDEMATISRPTDNIPRNSKVIVYGENDEQATKTPHFHVQIDNGDIELEIKFEHIKNMDIWRTKNNYPKSWNGITDVRDRIIEWFDEVTKNNFGVSNLKRMIMTWNDANPTNEIDEQFTESFTISKLELHYWTEVSGIIEHYYFKKHNGFPIPNNMASKILGVPDSQITPSKKDMIHYNRVIGQDNEKFTKMICGIKSEEIFYEVMSEFENNYDFMKEVNKMVNESKETKYSVKQAIYIIESLYIMHEDNALNELIPKWHDALRDSVEVLNSTKEKTQTISDYIEYGNFLLSDTQILTLNVIK